MLRFCEFVTFFCNCTGGRISHRPSGRAPTCFMALCDQCAWSRLSALDEVYLTVDTLIRGRRESTSPFDAHCCHMGTAIKHPVLPDRVKQSFVIFDIRAL